MQLLRRLNISIRAGWTARARRDLSQGAPYYVYRPGSAKSSRRGRLCTRTCRIAGRLTVALWDRVPSACAHLARGCDKIRVALKNTPPSASGVKELPRDPTSGSTRSSMAADNLLQSGLGVPITGKLPDNVKLGNLTHQNLFWEKSSSKVATCRVGVLGSKHRGNRCMESVLGRESINC